MSHKNFFHRNKIDQTINLFHGSSFLHSFLIFFQFFFIHEACEKKKVLFGQLEMFLPGVPNDIIVKHGEKANYSFFKGFLKY